MVLFHPALLLIFEILPTCTFIPTCTIIRKTKVGNEHGQKKSSKDRENSIPWCNFQNFQVLKKTQKNLFVLFYLDQASDLWFTFGDLPEDELTSEGIELKKKNQKGTIHK